MSPRRKILYVNHEVECGGAEHSLLELIQGLDHERFEVHLACSMEGPLTDRARELGAEIHLVPMLFQGKLRKLWGLFRASMRLRKLIRSAGIQLVHTNSLIAGYCGIFAAKLCNIPSIWHVRDISYPDPAKKLCTQARRVIANSKATAESLDVPEQHENKVEVIYNGVAPRFFEQAESGREVREELQVNADEKLVGIFGRLDPWKGHRDFLRASKRILSSHSNTTFVVVGDVLFAGTRTLQEGFRERLENYTREIGVFGKVLFLGHRTDVPRLLAAMSVVVHPSAEPEPFGRVIAEAHAVGVPVVASALGGIPEIITHGVNGFLFTPGDTEELAECVCRLLGDEDLASELGRTGREMAEHRFTQGQHAAEMEAIYDEL
jgi:glycosyltransferase involved in cell wall biosynthesis